MIYCAQAGVFPLPFGIPRSTAMAIARGPSAGLRTWSSLARLLETMQRGGARRGLENLSAYNFALGLAETTLQLLRAITSTRVRLAEWPASAEIVPE